VSDHTEALRIAEGGVRDARAHLANAEGWRDDAIRKAHRDGMTTRAIAEHVGVSHQRVAQIVHPSSLR
jgi:hypothetical protein